VFQDYGNCLTWALWRLATRGGYVAFRRTKMRGGWWPHALWSPDLKRWYSFVPLRDEPIFPWLPVPKIFFEGYIVPGDDYD
jgi:hypothetical protein